MTKGTPNELQKYTATPFMKQLFTSELGQVTVQLPLRESYVWQRLGGAEAVRALIAPVGVCVHCAESKTWPDSHLGWFCFTCHRDLSHLGLLPLPD